MKRPTFTDAFQSVTDSVAWSLRTLGRHGLFPHFNAADASAVIEALLAHVLAQRLAAPWQLIPALQTVLTQWSEQHGRPLPPGLLLVTQSSAIRIVSIDAWEEEEELDDQDGADEADAALASDNPLAGMSSTEITQYLIKQLKEPSAQINLFKRYVDIHKADGIWQLLSATNKALEEKSAVTKKMDGTPRTGGGVFIKLARERDAQLKNLDAEQKKLEASPSEPLFELRDYQQAAVGCIRDQGGNWVVTAPTNTGKTAIFIEISKLRLRADPSDKTLVIVPTVSLAAQHCCSYMKAGFRGPATTHPLDPPPAPFLLPGHPRPRVDCFFSEHPLRPECWEEELERLSVLVIEAGSFRNLLSAGTARLEHVDLLVFDECHHVLKKHPYALIMQEYKPDLGKPQVLGFSASPAGGSTVDKVRDNLDGLLKRLYASLHIVSGEQVEVVAPAPRVEELYFVGREEDALVRRQLLDAMMAVALRVGLDLQRMIAAEAPAGPTPAAPAAAGCRVQPLHPRTAAELVGGVQALRAAAVAGGAVERYNLLCLWARRTRELAAGWGMKQLQLCMVLFEVLRKCLELTTDVGQECALQTLGCQLQHLAARGGRAAAKDAARRASGAGSSTPQSPGSSTPSPASSAASLASLVGAAAAGSVPLPALLQHVMLGPRARDVAVAQRRSKRVAAPRPPTDIDSSVLELCRMVLQALPYLGDGSHEAQAAALPPPPPSPVPAPAPSPPCPRRRAAALQLVAEAVGAVVPGHLRPPPACNPKIWHLIAFLHRYRDEPSLHGIVFSRMQQGAHYLAEVLRAASQPSPRPGAPPPPLGFVESVHVLVGHGSVQRRTAAPRSGAAGPAAGAHRHGSHINSKGMTASRQQSVLEQFKAPGRRLLVATNAAEEGLDIPCCEFVVRFTPAASGIQLVQAKGRGRKLGSNYYCLVQSGFGSDEKLHLKSTQEEDAMKQALAGLVQGGDWMA